MVRPSDKPADDSAEWQELFEGAYKHVVQRFGGDANMVEMASARDVVQEAFLRCLGAETFKMAGDTTNRLRYLKTTCNNIMANQFKMAEQRKNGIKLNWDKLLISNTAVLAKDVRDILLAGIRSIDDCQRRNDRSIRSCINLSLDDIRASYKALREFILQWRSDEHFRRGLIDVVKVLSSHYRSIA